MRWNLFEAMNSDSRMHDKLEERLEAKKKKKKQSFQSLAMRLGKGPCLSHIRRCPRCRQRRSEATCTLISAEGLALALESLASPNPDAAIPRKALSSCLRSFKTQEKFLF